ncbi:MAG: hypothetical protein AAF958_02330 [Planctomycetota bacterium]
MNRFSSSVAPFGVSFLQRQTVGLSIAASLLMMGAWAAPIGCAFAQDASQYVVDPDGNAYQKVVTQVTRPVIETKMERRNQTTYTPRLVTTTTPATRTVYTPVVEHHWEPRVHGRWNPFTQPTIAYHHVSRTRFQPRTEVVENRQTRSEWVAETRVVEEPTQRTSWKTEQQTELRFVGKVAPKSLPQPGAATNAIASRLRPLSANEQIQPPAASIASGYTPTRIAMGTVGSMTSDPPRRSPSQRGIRAQELVPTSNSQGSPLPTTGTLFR